LHKAISELRTLNPNLPLQEQLENLFKSTKKTPSSIDRAKNIQQSKQACKQQCKLAIKNPKKAHKEIFRDKNAQPRAGLQALRNPEDNHLETETKKIAQIVEKYYSNALKNVNIKTGTYLPEEAPRSYPWEQAGAQTRVPDPFTLQSQITKDESEGRQERD